MWLKLWCCDNFMIFCLCMDLSVLCCCFKCWNLLLSGCFLSCVLRSVSSVFLILLWIVCVWVFNFVCCWLIFLGILGILLSCVLSRVIVFLCFCNFFLVELVSSRVFFRDRVSASCLFASLLNFVFIFDSVFFVFL